MGRVWNETLRLESIRTDIFLQPREEEELDLEHLERLPEDVDSLAPVHVFRVENIGNLLAGGHYRMERVARAGRDVIKATVHEGTWADAFLFSRGENRTHGKPRTKKDVRHAIIQAFVARKQKGLIGILTDKAIAESIPIDKRRVSELRQEWEEESGNGLSAQSASGQGEESPSDDDFDRGETDEGDEEEGEDADAPPKPPRPRRSSPPPKLEPLPGALDFDAAMEEGSNWYKTQNATPEMKRHRVLEALHKNLHNAAACMAALDADDGGAVLKAWRKRLQAIWEGIRAIAEK